VTTAKKKDEHGAAGDGHPIAEVGCRRSFAPLTLSSSLDRSLLLLLWLSLDQGKMQVKLDKILLAFFLIQMLLA
jgi:hypothetical protein